MTFSKVLYFGDFFVLPFALAGFSGIPLEQHGFIAAPEWLACLIFGLASWTLVEYCVHRYVYHHAPYFTGQHQLHHADPDALIGFPSFLSIGIISAVSFFPLRFLGPVAAGGFTSGMLLGYGYYVFLHYATHHFPIRPGGVFYRARVRHMAHHYRDTGNFGVTTGFWDQMFGTNIARRETMASH